MRGVAIRIFAALTTFLIGVAISSVWFLTHPQPAKSVRLLSEPPCREGLVSGESLPDAPLRITILDTACRDPRTANVHFVVENLSAKPISKYEIRGVQIYDELRDHGLGVRTDTTEPLQPRQTQIGFLGGGVLTGGRW